MSYHKKLIKAIVVNTSTIILYDDKGDSYTYPQGSHSVKQIVENIIPEFKKHNECIVDVLALCTEQAPKKSILGRIAGVSFFSATKKFVKSIFKDETDKEEEQSDYILGEVTYTSETIQHKRKELLEAHTAEEPEKVPEKTVEPKKKSLTAVKKKSNKSLSSDDMRDAVLAMLDTGEIIPHVEDLASHIVHAKVTNTEAHIAAFLKRTAPIIDNRNHSIKDLMAFMKVADLPISKSGYIIAYKQLGLYSELKGEYVDLYSGRIVQKVGDIVCMPEHCVDNDRTRDCSHGFHIASKSYLGSYGGSNPIVVCYIDPADVIAVPQYDTNKVRVSSYRIVDLLPPSVKSSLLSSGGMTSSSEGTSLLKKYINEEVISPLREVRQLQDKTIITTTLENVQVSRPEVKNSEPTNTLKPQVKTVEDVQEELAKEAKVNSKVNPASIIEQVETLEPEPEPKPKAAKPKAVKPKKVKKPRAEKKAAARSQGAILREELRKIIAKGVGNLNFADATRAIEIKRKLKKGWGVLGVDKPMVDKILELTSNK